MLRATDASSILAAHPGVLATSVAAPPLMVELDTYGLIALTAAELETLKAATDRVIPRDEIDSGATEAGVFVYIDCSLTRHLTNSLPAYAVIRLR